MRNLVLVLFGVAFGFVLSRSGAADYNVIQGMFLFERFQLYGVLAVGVGVTAPGIWLLKKIGKTATGEPLKVKAKPLHRGTVVGGALFGVGWALTGMCPGPVLVNMGEGKIYAIAAFAGVLAGTYLVGLSYPKIRLPLKMPPLGDGPGDG